MSKLKVKDRGGSIVASVLLAILAVYALSLIFMYVWAFITSLKGNLEFKNNMFGLPKGWPWQWKWQNYVSAFTEISVPVMRNGRHYEILLLGLFGNTFIYAITGAVITNFVQWMVAYLLCKFPYKLSKFLYALNLILMVIPVIGTLPSALSLFKAVGLYNNWWYVIVNSIGFGGMSLLIFYGFHNGIGKEYTEAAVAEGAGNFTTMMKIIFPISSQMFFVLALIMFIGRWNDYMTMVIWLPSYPTLAYGIYRLSTATTTAASWVPPQVAACMMLFIPVFVIFLFTNDVMMRNLRVGGLKG